MTQKEAETQAEGEAGSLCGEPDAGLDPGTPGSLPELKADAQPLSHPGAPRSGFGDVSFILRFRLNEGRPNNQRHQYTGGDTYPSAAFTRW